MFWLKRLLGVSAVLLLAVAVVWTFSARQRETTAVTANPAAPPVAAPTVPLAAYLFPVPTSTVPPRSLPAYPIATATSLHPTLAPPTSHPTLTLAPPPPTSTPGVQEHAPGPSTVQYVSEIEASSVNQPHLTPRFGHFRIWLGTDRKPTAPAAAIQLPSNLSFTPTAIWPSPTGDYMVLMESGMPCCGLHVLNVRSGNVKPVLSQYGGGRFYGWHPDGRRFLIWIDVQQVGLQLIDAETLQGIRLATPHHVQGGAISPDGSRIAYIDTNLPGAQQSLWLVSSTGGDTGPFVDLGDIAHLHPHAWSPDARHLVYAGRCGQTAQKGTGGGQSSPASPLCVLDTVTRTARPISLPGYIDTRQEPRWSPDGRYLAVSARTGAGQVCQGPKGSEPSWADPCLYAGYQVHIVDTTTDQVHELTTGISPVWSPDGLQIAFLSNRGGTPEVWSMELTQRDERQLTNDRQPKSPYGHLLWNWEVQK